jgi:hypothetical protein
MPGPKWMRGDRSTLLAPSLGLVATLLAEPQPAGSPRGTKHSQNATPAQLLTRADVGS